LGKTRIPPLPVTGELFELYQPAIGQTATLLWLNLRWAAHSGNQFELDDWAAKLRIAPSELYSAIEMLSSYSLVEIVDDGELIVHDPLPHEAFETKFKEDVAHAAADESEDGAMSRAAAKLGHPRGEASLEASLEGATSEAEAEASSQARLPLAGQKSARRGERRGAAAENASSQPVLRSPLSKRRRNAHMLKLVEEKPEAELPLNEDMQAVVQIYHKRIGMMGPTQYERLRFWVEEQGMEGAVVALAIEETVQSADVPRISYLEGILRNWFNDGIRTLADVHRQKRASKVLGKGEQHAMRQGVPNAGAYQSVNPELVAKWKEMYPDEYDA